MTRKTRVGIKNCYLFLIFFFTSTYSMFGQAQNTDLAVADSLFTVKKYTESFEIYNRIFSKDKKSSPSMLLKMAFIKEGLGDYSNALYYLSTYFTITLDKKSLNKMSELANTNDLKGYSTSEFYYFKEIVKQNYHYPIAFLVVLLAVGILFAAKYAGKGKSPVALIVLLILMLPFIFVINYNFSDTKAIVIKDSTFLMDGPSGSSNVKETISKGHRLYVQKSKGVWSKVTWENKTYYVRKSKLKELI